MNISPCESFNRDLDKYINKFNGHKSDVSDKMDFLNDTLNDSKGKEGVEDLSEQLASNKSSILSEVNSVKRATSGFTGSCLDSLTSSINDMMNDINAVTSNLYNIAHSDVDFNILGSAISGIKDLLDNIGLSDLLGKIDELLGCLADNNDCIPTDKIDRTMANINDFLDTHGLEPDGSFDLEKKLTSTDGLTENLINNIKELSESSSSVGEEIMNIIKPSLPGVDPLKW